jgi:hypothetical protein
MNDDSSEPAGEQHHDITLRPRNPDNDPADALRELVASIVERVRPLAYGDSGLPAGLSDAERLLAEQIYSLVMDELSRRELARTSERELQLEERRLEYEHEERMFELITRRVEAISAAVAAFERLQAMGVDVQLDVIVRHMVAQLNRSSLAS